MNTTMQDALNEQIRAEFYSAYLYLSMAAHFEADNLDGFAHWMRLQAQEELGHAMRLYDHVNRSGGRVVLFGIEEPPRDFGAPVSVFKEALAHEREVTRLIHELVRLARAESDLSTESALQWFVDEQVEEEDTAARAIHQLEMAGEDTAALLMLDQQFGQRTDAA